MRALPGDAATVLRTGEQLERTAEAISTASSQLRAIAQPDRMVSLAISRIREDAGRVASEISGAEGRYRETGAALVDYATALADAQERAARAMDDHADASSSLAGAEARESELRTTRLQLAEAPADDPRVQETADDLRRAGGQAAGFEAERDAAAARYDSAVADLETAAERAIGRIQDVVDGDGLSDSVWDHVAGFFSDLASFAADLFRAALDALVNLVLAIVELVVTVLLLIAAVIVLGLAILAAVALAILALAVIAFLLVVAVVLAVVLALIMVGLLAFLLVVLVLVVVRVAVFIVSVLATALVYLLQGRDPLDALVQAAILNLMVQFPALWALVGLAAASEASDPVFAGHDEGVPSEVQDLGQIMADNVDVDDLGHDPADPDDVNADSVVRVVTIHAVDEHGEPMYGPDGQPVLVYRVHIPSTQQWTPGGTSANDVTSDLVGKMAPWQQTQLERAVEDAMTRAGVPEGASVMLSGWSLGGITAGNLAADPEFAARYDVAAVVTAGSSIDDAPIGLNTHVLDVSHSQDPVPRTENPFLPDHRDDSNRTHIDVPAPAGGGNAVGHAPGQYLPTMAALDSDPTAQAFVSEPEVARFFGESVGVDDYRYNRG